MTKRKLPPAFDDLLDAARGINRVGEPIVEFPLSSFVRDWLPRFIDETDESYRSDWIKQVVATPFGKCALLDKDGNLAVMVPAMFHSTGNYLPPDLNMEQFLNNYRYAMTFAGGGRATNMMEHLAKEGVQHSELPIDDIRGWVTFFEFFEQNPPWVQKAREFINKIDVATLQKNGGTNNTTVTDQGAGDAGFGSADDFEPI